jgi:hypothetical protein
MNRVQKIQLLEGIKEGRLSKKILIRPQSYLFTEKEEGENIFYEMGGRLYTQEEHDKICDEVELDNKNLESLGLKELCTIVITIVYVKGKTIL